MPSTNNKDKPWDTDDIDKWKVDAFTAEDNKGGTLAEESSFATVDATSISSLAESDLRSCFPNTERHTYEKSGP